MTNDIAGLRVECSHCAARVRIPPERIGQPSGCPRCGRSLEAAAVIGSTSGSGETPAATEPTGHVETACPSCGVGLRVRAVHLGRQVRCGSCRAKFRVAPSRVSILDAASEPAPIVAGSEPAVTPDPDDPWQGRAEVMRLLDEIANLKRLNARLASEVERLEQERDAARDEPRGPRRAMERAVIPFRQGEPAPMLQARTTAGTTGG